MKKNLKLSIIITSVVNVVCCLINYICARFFEFLPIGFHMSGGEYDGYSGFGILLEKIYPMTAYPEDSSAILRVSFSFPAFMIYFVLTFILIFAIVSVIRLLRNKKN